MERRQYPSAPMVAMDKNVHACALVTPELVGDVVYTPIEGRERGVGQAEGA